VERTTFTIDELVSLTIEFYRRNYIEGLFLSSGVHRNPDYTMEQMIAVVKDLRQKHCFNGYIHMKSIPGASEELVFQAGLYADRMSVNLEIADEKNLKLVAPEKNYASIFSPMRHIQQKMLETSEDSKKMRSTPKFVPAGQSTQLIVGATSESDNQILNLASKLYKRPTMKRVYYSGYIPVNDYDTRLPSLKSPPLVRENRLYQADWLLRFYQFSVHEIVDDNNPNLDLSVDPKLGWALRNPHVFPIDVNQAPYEMILRVPGIGVKSAKLILASRRFGKLNSMQLKKIGVVMKRAQYFIVSRELSMHTINEIKPETIKGLLTNKKILMNSVNNQQLSIDWNV
jgi:putative DNA modification/repair radical SAM protein